MKWNKYTIETTTAAEDFMSSMLMELGIEGIEIEDHLPLSEEDKKKWRIYDIPIIPIAKDEVGNVITQSVVALGVAMEFTHVMDIEKVRERMLSSVPDKVKDANNKAYDLGIKYAKEAKQS